MFKCIRPFKFHKFARWESLKAGNLVKTADDGNHQTTVGTYLLQERTCADCGFVQQRLVKART